MFLLDTERLRIDIPSPKDINDWYLLHSDPEVMQYLDGCPHKNMIQKWLEQDIMHYNTHGFSFGSLRCKKTQEFAGRAGLVYLNYEDHQPDIEIGYVLKRNCWGKGYATELAKALVLWGFANLSVHKLVAVTHPDNSKSQHVLTNVGMHFAKCINVQGTGYYLYEIYRR